MAEEPLGRLEYLDPREVWSNEAGDFTPWLLENEEYLGDLLGIDLALHGREHAVGRYAVDLFGTDETNQRPLIVENQLEETDHRHLSQLLTYAAGTDARTIVWVSPSFRDEHHQALEFLNDVSDGDTRFFGVEVRVGRIGNSKVAPIFRVVSSPSNWKAQVRSVTRASDRTERETSYMRFWTGFLEVVHAQHPNLTRRRNAPYRHYLELKTVRKSVKLVAGFSRGGIFSEIYIGTTDSAVNDRIFRALRQSSHRLPKTLANSLVWDEMEGKLGCRIKVNGLGTVRDNKSHPEMHKWMADQCAQLLQTIGPLVDELDEELWDPDLEDPDLEDEDEG